MSKKIEIDKKTLYRLKFIERKSTEEIANICSCNTRTVRERLLEHGLNNSKISSIFLKKAVYLYNNSDYSINEIIKICNIGRCLFFSYLSTLDIKRRIAPNKIKKWITKVSKETLKNLYITKNIKCKDLGKHLNCSYHIVHLLLNYYKINKPTIKINPKFPRDAVIHKNWKMKVLAKDNYECKACKIKKGGSFQAHHIKSFVKNPSLRYSVDNGITLCEKCHDPKFKGSFHNIYGTRNFTKQNLLKYINSKQGLSNGRS